MLLLIFIVMTALATAGEGVARVAPGLCSAVLAAVVIDLPILRLRAKRWEFPSGAILTGFIVAMVLSPHEPWYVSAATSAVGVLSKYVGRTRSANVFNPAALALVATFYVFDTGHSWWGALPEVAPWVALPVLLAAGGFITDRVNKAPLVLAFLGTYYLLFTATAFTGDPRHVAEVFVAPDLQAVLYFAFFILTDPPTSPTKYPDQLLCGVLVAVTGYVVFEWVGAAYYLLAGVLVGNVFEAWRRTRRASASSRPDGPRPAAGRRAIPSLGTMGSMDALP